MKKVVIFLGLFFLLAINTSLAQNNPTFSVTISSDSVLLGNYLKVTFTLENAEGTAFESPNFEGFQVVSGPNMSSSYSMINGVVTQQVAYTYYVEPLDIGQYYITPASISTAETTLETMPITVNVYPNPEGIQQNIEERTPSSNPFELFNDDWMNMEWPSFDERLESPEPEAPQEPKKKKRKRIRI